MNQFAKFAKFALALGAVACGASASEDDLMTHAPDPASMSESSGSAVRTAFPIQISEERARELLAKGNTQSSQAADPVSAASFDALLSQVKVTEGRERRELLMRYMAAADQLPEAPRAEMKTKLFKAFQ